jgi:hypothetical protein
VAVSFWNFSRMEVAVKSGECSGTLISVGFRDSKR